MIIRQLVYPYARTARLAILASLLASVCFGSLFAQQDKPGILILAHGGSESWNDEVLNVRNEIDPRIPTEVAFGMATKRTIQEAADRLAKRGVSRIIAVPLFISPHSSIITSSEYLLGLRPAMPKDLEVFAKMDHGDGGHGNHSSQASHDEHGNQGGHMSESMDPLTPIRNSLPISITGALGSHQLVADILASRADALSKDPQNEALVVVAHGPVSDEENALWLGDMRELIAKMRAQAKFQRVEYMTVRDDAPEPIRSEAAQELRGRIERITKDGKRALIVPLLLSFGGIEKGIHKRLEGLGYTMSEQALLPDARIAQWILLQAGVNE